MVYKKCHIITPIRLIIKIYYIINRLIIHLAYFYTAPNHLRRKTHNRLFVQKKYFDLEVLGGAL